MCNVCLFVCLSWKSRNLFSMSKPHHTFFAIPCLLIEFIEFSLLSSVKVAVSPQQWWRMKLSSHPLSLVYLGLALVCFFICLEQIKSYLSYPKGTTVQVFGSTRVSTNCHCFNFLSNSRLIVYVQVTEFLKVRVSRSLDRAILFWFCTKSWNLNAPTNNLSILSLLQFFLSLCLTQIKWYVMIFFHFLLRKNFKNKVLTAPKNLLLQCLQRNCLL